MASPSAKDAASATTKVGKKKSTPLVPTISTDHERNPSLSIFRANYPITLAMTRKAAAKDGKGDWLKSDSHAVEVKAVMEGHKLRKPRGPLRRMRDGSEDNGVTDEDGVPPRRGTDLAPCGKNWGVWFSDDVILQAAEEIKRSKEGGKSVSGIVVRGVGGPLPSCDDLGDFGEPDHVRASVSWHHGATDVLTWMREDRARRKKEEAERKAKEEEERQRKADALAHSLKEEEGEVTAPETLRIPPYLPEPRVKSAKGIIEQYEKFIVHDGQVYSPMCQWWGKTRTGISNRATLSVRYKHYCGARYKCPQGDAEGDSRGLNDLLKDANRWSLLSGHTKPKWKEFAAAFHEKSK